MNSSYRIRCASIGDAQGIAAIYGPMVEHTIISFEERAPDRGEMARRMEALAPQWPWLIAEAGGGIVAGYAYASAHHARAAYRWSVDVTVYLAGAHRGRRVGTALYAALMRLLTLQGYHRAYAGIALPNDASVALHRAFGFELVGVYTEVGYKFGAWHDVAWFQCPIGSAPEGREPQPFASLDPQVVAQALDPSPPQQRTAIE
jgi:L-amino acid N-acyltransferase YncA